MTSEPEAEVSDVAPATAAAQSASDSGDAAAGTLLEVTFQRNPRQKYKYLEAEPKILGVTEIALTVFFIGCRIQFYTGLSVERITNVVLLAFSCVGIIAGSVAIAAQKLHLPTLKACLGMQVVTCLAYTFCLLITLNQHENPGSCWYFHNDSEIINENHTCLLLQEGFSHLSLLDQLMEASQIALSATLAAYCCKVIPCCTPRSNVPVIIMAPPTAPQ
ncbi:membrane-spanning 4-domains subfamily A member 4A-like [Chanodichthys erythropterus]|uniref:membrane-spanning 4-domains subfamily A member 4A-like n=1 Tax=Chanodichthys erythropterus TaxID=933992 RepID=UPI00351EE971